uniref:SH3 domain-containing YSC84-like protein 1 n=1 Tax=Cyprinodon variegatus TaxID=28743 RepID=A0A3Q2DDM9_CYPVA
MLVSAVNPIPCNLKSEAKKAAKILRDFTQISNRTGPDKLIPAHIIAKAEGLAIISVIKAGFMVTARGGSGVVIARLADRRWSAPSAIGIAGLGGGFEIGVEVSQFNSIQYGRGGEEVGVSLVRRRRDMRAKKSGDPGGKRRVKLHELFSGVSVMKTKQAGLLSAAMSAVSYDVGEEQRSVYNAGHIFSYDGKFNVKMSFFSLADVTVGGATSSLVVTATHPFTGQQPGDLSFVPGDRITVITKTDSQYDWWEGKLDNGNVGIFPANFVTY